MEHDKESVMSKSNVDSALSSASYKMNHKTETSSSPSKSSSSSQVKMLKQFVEENHLSITFNGDKYLLHEAWLFIFNMRKCTPSIESISIEKDGDKIICSAHACLYNEAGRMISSAFMEASSDEQVAGFGRYAVVSMAQTRAISKLGRQVFGWLPYAAGFKATPAEEMRLKQ